MDPELIVADEPVSMLDVSIRTELLRLMLDLRQERGLTYLFITHDLSLAWVIADRIAVMYLGKIMEIGPAEAVIRDPRNPYTQALVSVSPSPDPPDRRARARKRTILEGETPDAAHIPTGCRFHPRCPLAFDRCRVEEPPLFDVGGGQAAACWLAEPGARAGRRAPMLRRPPGGDPTAAAPVPTGAATAGPPVADATLARRDAAPTRIAGLLRRRRDHHGRDRRPGCRGWLASGAGRVERERVRRPSHRGGAARLRRPDPADRRRRRPPGLPPDLEDWDPPAVAEARRDHLRDGGSWSPSSSRSVPRASRWSVACSRPTSARRACTPRSGSCASTSCSANGSTTTATTSASSWP